MKLEHKVSIYLSTDLLAVARHETGRYGHHATTIPPTSLKVRIFAAKEYSPKYYPTLFPWAWNWNKKSPNSCMKGTLF
jgi:hypothetical protein